MLNRIKKIASSLFAFLVMTGLAHAVEVTISDVRTSPGKSFELPIYVSDLTGQGIKSYTFTLNFDPSILMATGASSARSISSSWNAPVSQISSGRIEVQGSGSEALSGAGRLVYVQFAVKLSAPIDNVSALNFSQFSFNNGSPSANPNSAEFTVLADDTAPIITSGPNPESVTSHSASLVWQTDEDAISIVEYGLTSSYGMTASDSTLKNEHRVTIDSLRPSTAYHYRVRSTDRWGNGPTSSSGMAVKTDDINLSLDSFESDPGSEITVPVMLSDVTGHGIRALSFEVEFSSDILMATGVSIDGTIASAWDLPRFSVSAGRVTVRLSGDIDLVGNGTVAKNYLHDSARFGGREFNAIANQKRVPEFRSAHCGAAGWLSDRERYAAATNYRRANS